ncbi:MAG TPA: MlaD family protein [Phycisphaerae bacterium]|nr:MlaD family protein [Phycisphaerae bacterium]
MARHPARNRVVAGAFLLLMAAAAVAILVVVGGWRHWLQPKQTLQIRFDAAPNVKAGGPVLLAGHPVGRVADIQVVEVPSPLERQGEVGCYLVEVVVQLPKHYHIHQNARITIQQALVGQSALINIEDVGYGDLVKDYVAGKQASPFAGAAHELGIGEKEKKDVSEILANLRQTTETLRDGLPDIIDKLKTTGANLAEASEKVKGTIERVDGILEENRENLKATVASARGMIENASKKTDEVLENLKGTTEKLQAVVDENRPDIRQTVTRARSAIEKVDAGAGDILEKVKAASGDLQTAVADFKVIASDTKALVATNRGNIAVMLQSFRETGDHLRALSKEVRRAPWRLFATPDKEEVESLNLYDAARAFAMAATDLDALADTLEVMIEAQKRGVDVDLKILQTMQKDLEETFKKYREAENALMEEYKRIQK